MAHTATHTDPATTLLVTMLMAQENPYETLMALRPALNGATWDAVCGAMEVCEVHMTDAQICRDDQQHCPAGRGQ